MKTTFTKKSNQKLEELGRILEFFIFLYGVLMIFAVIISLRNGKTHISIYGMEQVLMYISIATVGVIVCFTDIIFSKISAKRRLIIYVGVVYLSSLVYFKDMTINPLYDMTNFIIYTLYFIFVGGMVIFIWSLHENSEKKNYEEIISKYQLNKE